MYNRTIVHAYDKPHTISFSIKLFPVQLSRVTPIHIQNTCIHQITICFVLCACVRVSVKSWSLRLKINLYGIEQRWRWCWEPFSWCSKYLYKLYSMTCVCMCYTCIVHYVLAKVISCYFLCLFTKCLVSLCLSFNLNVQVFCAFHRNPTNSNYIKRPTPTSVRNPFFLSLFIYLNLCIFFVVVNFHTINCVNYNYSSSWPWN